MIKSRYFTHFFKAERIKYIAVCIWCMYMHKNPAFAKKHAKAGIHSPGRRCGRVLLHDPAGKE